MVRYLVLGAGFQGTAAVHDLFERCDASAVRWIDNDARRLGIGAERIRSLCARTLGGPRAPALVPEVADAGGDGARLAAAFASSDVCLNALPYRFAPAMTRLALDAGCHYLDLGGNTRIAREQLALHAAHPRAASLNVLPDCGLMPGMGNLLVALAVARLGSLERAHLRCGGLPQEPEPPLDYALLFSVEGLVNEYFGEADVLIGGRPAKVRTFEGLERVDVPGVGELEAFLTSGGLSTTPWTFAGRIGELDYKTLRYPGHHAKFRLLLDLGLLDERPVEVEGREIAPRSLLHVLLRRVLERPGTRDLAILTLDAVAHDGRRIRARMLDRFDEATGFTAMERTTAYSATACAHLVALGEVVRGPGPLETAIEPERYVDALAARGIAVEIEDSGGERAATRRGGASCAGS